MTFDTYEQAEEEFYKTHTPNSDDSDDEGARVERWIEDNEITIKENE